jgi:alpha-tubulin suppressor-like RCC1 family protein
MAPGNQTTCGLITTGAAYCWGINSSGQLGDGTTTTRTTPTAVGGSIVFAKISTGNAHVCGLTAAGLAYCWGLNSSGQVGDGSQFGKPNPTPVKPPTN